MNARGIPTAAYQVLYLLTEVGVPPLLGTPLLGTPWPGLMGDTQPQVPPVSYPSVGYSPQPGLTGRLPNLGYPHWVPPSQVQQGGTQPQVPPLGTPCQLPPLAGPGRVPPPSVWTWLGTPIWTWLGTPLDLARVPPIGVDRQTETCQKHNLPSYYVRGR